MTTACKPSKKPKVPATPKPATPKVAHVVAPEEYWADGKEILRFTIPGQPATKKNSSRIICRGRRNHTLLSSEQYVAYEAHCQEYCEEAWQNTGKSPMDYGVAIIMRVFLKTWTVGDANGYMQSIGDILQKWNVLKDDSWIHWRDGDQHWFGGVDADNPRVELIFLRYRHPKEEYRTAQEANEKLRLARAAARALKNTSTSESINVGQQNIIVDQEV